MRLLTPLIVSVLVLVSVVTLAAAQQKTVAPPGTTPAKGFDFNGRIEATTVEIRPRVTGCLMKILVKEGAMVKQGDLLAEIDPQQYKADLDVARAKLTVAEATSKVAISQLARLKELNSKGVIGQDDLIQAAGEKERSEALIHVANAEVVLAELNLSWTKLNSPMDGRVGQFAQTAGNLVTADGPAIVSIVAVDHVFVSFDVDERTMLKLRRDGLAEIGKLTALVGLSDEDGYPHKATVDFIDPQFNPKTGTVRVRGVLPNPKGLFSPGMFARVRLIPAEK